MNHLFTEVEIKQQIMREEAAARRLVRAIKNSHAAQKGHRISLRGGYTQFILALIR